MGEKKNQKGQRWYLAVDLKSFYSSVECRERDLDPLDTNLVVADAGRTAKTICLAVSPSLKSFGIPGRPRLFEVLQRVQEINRLRRKFIQGRSLGIGSNLYLAKVPMAPSLWRRQRIRERQLQRTSLEIQRKFGSHALFKALSLREEATALERSRQIGGHRA